MIFRNIRFQHSLVMMIAALASMGCSKKAASDLASIAGLYNTVSSGCVTATDPLTSADHHNLHLTLNADGTYSTTDYWYTGTCSNSNTSIVYFQSGSFAVGGAITGGTAMTFTVTSARLMPYNTTVQASINTGCGGTSPYAGGTNTSYNGIAKNMFSMTCYTATMPTSNGSIYNVFDLDATTGFAIGTPYAGAPGMYSAGSVSSTANMPMM